MNLKFETSMIVLLCEERSAKISRIDDDLFSIKLIKWDRRFLNTADIIRGLVISAAISASLSSFQSVTPYSDFMPHGRN